MAKQHRIERTVGDLAAVEKLKFHFKHSTTFGPKVVLEVTPFQRGGKPVYSLQLFGQPKAVEMADEFLQGFFAGMTHEKEQRKSMKPTLILSAAEEAEYEEWAHRGGTISDELKAKLDGVPEDDPFWDPIGS